MLSTQSKRKVLHWTQAHQNLTFLILAVAGVAICYTTIAIAFSF